MDAGTGEKLNQTLCPPPQAENLDLDILYLHRVIPMLKWKIFSLELYLGTAPSQNGEGDGG